MSHKVESNYLENYSAISNQGPNLIASKNTRIEVDVGAVAKKALASAALTFTNSVLTIAVAVTKLTGFLIIPSFVLGKLSEPLHKANVALSEHAFTPFRRWTEVLSKENKRIMETDKVIEFTNKKLMFYPEAYKKQAHDSVKAALAPVSLALSVTNAALWLAVKPLYLAFFVPGFVADGFLCVPFVMNKGIGCLTYSPLKKISDSMFEHQCKLMEKTSRVCSL